jgi:hypothetical protein
MELHLEDNQPVAYQPKVQHAHYFWLLMLKTNPTRMVLDNGFRVMPEPEGTR